MDDDGNGIKAMVQAGKLGRPPETGDGGALTFSFKLLKKLIFFVFPC